MSYNYKPLSQTAERLIAKFGLEATAETKGANNDFDPTNPNVSQSVITKGKAVQGTLTQSYVSRYHNIIKEEDVMLLCSASLDLKEGSIITFNDKKWLIIKTNPIKPADTVLAYEAHARSL